MKKTKMLVLVAAGCVAFAAVADDSSSLAQRWRVRFDIGGTFPEAARLTEIGGPITGGGELKLSPGLQFDLAAGYRVTPWLTLEAELGSTFNTVDSVGNWSYPNSEFWQMLMMANVVVEFPRGRLVPFAGVGAGGALSILSFGNYYDGYSYDGYSYTEPDGSGTDFVPAFQAFGGLRYRFSDQWNVGVVYRFLATGHQNWDVDWWDGRSFRVGVDSICLQSICLVVSGNF